MDPLCSQLQHESLSTSQLNRKKIFAVQFFWWQQGFTPWTVLACLSTQVILLTAAVYSVCDVNSFYMIFSLEINQPPWWGMLYVFICVSAWVFPDVVKENPIHCITCKILMIGQICALKGRFSQCQIYAWIKWTQTQTDRVREAFKG